MVLTRLEQRPRPTIYLSIFPLCFCFFFVFFRLILFDLFCVSLVFCAVTYSETNDRNNSRLLDVQLVVYSGCWTTWRRTCCIIVAFEGVRIGQEGLHSSKGLQFRSCGGKWWSRGGTYSYQKYICGSIPPQQLVVETGYPFAPSCVAVPLALMPYPNKKSKRCAWSACGGFRVSFQRSRIEFVAIRFKRVPVSPSCFPCTHLARKAWGIPPFDRSFFRGCTLTT